MEFLFLTEDVIDTEKCVSNSKKIQKKSWNNPQIKKHRWIDRQMNREMDGWMGGWVDGCSLTCHCALLWTLFCTKLGRAWKDRKRESGCSLLLLLVVRFNFPQRRCFSRNLIWVKNGNPAVRLTEPNQNMVFFQRKNMRRPSSSAHQWLLSGGWAPRRVVITTYLHVCKCMCVCVFCAFSVCVCCSRGNLQLCSSSLLSMTSERIQRKNEGIEAAMIAKWGSGNYLVGALSLSLSISSSSLPLSPTPRLLCVVRQDEMNWELNTSPPTPPSQIYYANRSG